MQPDFLEMQISQCREDISERLPAIAARHSPLALLAALAEHVGGSLQLFMQSGACTREQARAVLEQVEQTAFK
jgi:hypothetical protein